MIWIENIVQMVFSPIVGMLLFAGYIIGFVLLTWFCFWILSIIGTWVADMTTPDA